MKTFRATLTKIGHAVLVLGERMVTVDWPKAIGEASIIFGLIVKIIYDIRTHSFTTFFTDLESVAGDIPLLGLALRLTASGNKEAIADPKIPVTDPAIPKDRQTNSHA